MGHEHEGVVKSFGLQYGFIDCQELFNTYGKAIYVAINAVRDAHQLVAGDKVAFLVEENQGRPHAAAVRVLSGPSLSRYTGIVSSFVDPPGYGFIKYQDASGESKIFLTGGEAMQAGVVVGDYCTFSIEESAKGSRARRVEKKNAAEGDARSPDAAGIPQLLQDFRLRYPHDDRANEMLVKSDVSVQRVVLAEFNCRRGRESDYSALLVAAVRRSMGREYEGVVKVFFTKYGFIGNQELLTLYNKDVYVQAQSVRDAWLVAGDKVAFMLGEVQGQPQAVAVRVLSGPGLSRHTGIVMSFFDPPGYGFIKYRDAGKDSQAYLKGDEARQAGVVVGDCCTFCLEGHAKGMQARHVEKQDAAEGDTLVPDAALVPQLLQDFRTRYPHDDQAHEKLVKSDETVQRAVLVEFKPKGEGESDYSALLVTVVRRIQERLEKAHCSSVPCKYGRKCKWSDCWFSHPSGEEEATQAEVVAGDSVEKQHAAEGDALFPDAALLPQLLQDFRLRYPHDDRANERLVKSEESVQRAVLVEFRSRSEGEGDYSALLMTAVLRIQDRLGKAHYSSVPCKYGRKCKRSDCWFQTQDHLVVVPRVLNPNVLVTSATCQLLRRRAQR